MKFSGRHIKLTVSELNHIKPGERVKVKDDYITILRVPGGFIYEYYFEDRINAVTFVSTDELRNE